MAWNHGEPIHGVWLADPPADPGAPPPDLEPAPAGPPRARYWTLEKVLFLAGCALLGLIMVLVKTLWDGLRAHSGTKNGVIVVAILTVIVTVVAGKRR